MTRRTILALGLTAPLTRAAPPRCAMGLVIHSFAASRPNGALDFLELSNSLGAGGIQITLRTEASGGVKALRERAGQYGMFLEGMSRLPRTDDTSDFEETVRQTKEAGALCIRTACLSGRRYETFDNLADWKEFVASSKAAIARAVPIVGRHRMPLAIENHKDWTTDEHLQLLKEYESEYVGVTLDTGNNMSLLDDPIQHTEALAPYAVATHLKDMGVEEYEEGFLLSELPFGAGVLDMPRIVKIIQRARPKTKMALEMITRDPLKIPCLTDKYWATFPDRNGRYLARGLAAVRANKRSQPLPRVNHLDEAAKVKIETENVRLCLDYAREKMGLVA